MILVDASLLIYAIDRDSPHHKTSRSWLETVLSGTMEVGFAWIVLLAFLRITTRPSIVQNPLKLDDALDYVDAWLDQPFAGLVVPGENHWRIFRRLLIGSGTAGNLKSDAHLAALALEHGGEIYSADHDFNRFAGVTHVNPLER